MDSQLLQSSTSVEGTSYAYATVSSSPPKKRAGRTKFRETRHPVYRGVRRRGSNGERWVCEMREPSKKSRIWLGTFPTAEMAARAHDVAAMALQGRKACLNFADSAWRLVVPNSACHKDIQEAAAVAAQMFRPSAGVADQEEQTSSPAQPLSPSPSACSVTELAAVESSSVFDLAGFDFGELQEQSYYGLALGAMQEQSYYGLPLGAMRGGWDYEQWDDFECSVADVSLWSY